MGIALVPCLMAEADAGLVRLLPEIELVGPEVWLLVHRGSVWSWMFWPNAPVPTWAALQGGPSRLLSTKCPLWVISGHPSNPNVGPFRSQYRKAISRSRPLLLALPPNEIVLNAPHQSLYLT
jgi:hypothetical protein